MVFYAPLMLIALWLAGRSLGFSDKSLWVVSALGAIFAALPVALSLIRPGGQKDQEAICESVMSVGIEAHLCNGAIAAIGWTFEDAIQVVSDYSTPLYILLAVLALAPLALVRARKGIFMSVAFALSALVPIFIVGADWGRWIHIAVAILTLTYFRCANARLLVWPPERLPTTVMALFAGTYALGWQMPHFAAAYWGPGVFSVGRSVLRTLGWL